MLIKANGAIKSIINKNVKTNNLDFIKLDFLVLQEKIVAKTENLINNDQIP